MPEITPVESIDIEGLLSVHQTFNIGFETLVSLGYIRGADLLSYGATITGLASGSGEVAFYEGQLAFPTELSGDTVYLHSTSASDTNDYLIQGTDANDEYQEETITATGTTPAASANTWNHVQRCVAKSAANAGEVKVSTASGSEPTTTSDQIQTVMLAGTSHAINPLLVAPKNRHIFITRFDFNTPDRDASIVRIFANREGNYIQNFKFYTSDAQFAQEFRAPIKLRPQDRLRVSVQNTSGSAFTGTFGMNGVVLRNTSKFGAGTLFGR